MYDDEFTILARNIRLLRAIHRLTQKEMADICGIGVVGFRRLEHGTPPPRAGVTILLALSTHFAIPVEDLFSPRFPNGNTKSRPAR